MAVMIIQFCKLETWKLLWTAHFISLPFSIHPQVLLVLPPSPTLRLPAPFHFLPRYPDSHLLPGSDQNYLLTMQEFPGCQSYLPPIYDIVAAKTIASKPKSDYISFLFRKSPGSFLSLGLYVLLFYCNDFYTLHVDSSFSYPRFQDKCHLLNGVSLAILSEIGPPLCNYLTRACFSHSVYYCNYLFVCL